VPILRVICDQVFRGCRGACMLQAYTSSVAAVSVPQFGSPRGARAALPAQGPGFLAAFVAFFIVRAPYIAPRWATWRHAGILKSASPHWEIAELELRTFIQPDSFPGRQRVSPFHERRVCVDMLKRRDRPIGCVDISSSTSFPCYGSRWERARSGSFRR